MSSDTYPLPFTTSETVLRDTPAFFATSREPDTPDLGQLPEPIQQSQPIQQPQQQSQPIQQPANLLPPSFEPKPITAEISLVADPATGEVR